MNSFPIDLQFKLLKNGLPEIMVMAKVKSSPSKGLYNFLLLKVWGFNVQRFEDEIGLVLSDVDIKQFEVNNNFVSV